jgi:hypothetical protein
MRILLTLLLLTGLAAAALADAGSDPRLYPSLQGISGLPGSNGESAPPFNYWHDAWLDPALLEGFSLTGGSGFIHAPAPQSLSNGLLGADLHAYRVGVGRGFPHGLEAGLQMDLDGLDQDVDLRSFFWRQLFYARWTPLDPWRLPIGLSFGAEGISFGDFGIGSHRIPVTNIPSANGWERYYVVAGGRVPHVPMAYAAAGWGGGAQGTAPFAALAVAPFAGAALLAEYDHGTDLGLRLLLSTQIKMDLSISDLQGIDWNQPFDLVLRNNVRFGISYAEMWP